jgi:hypothetical protein
MFQWGPFVSATLGRSEAPTGCRHLAAAATGPAAGTEPNRMVI